MKIKADYANTPVWKEFNVKSTLPKELECLDELAHNLWWVWNYDARELFCSLDEEIYERVGHNPVQLLELLSYERKEEIVKDKNIMDNVKAVYKRFKDYMNEKPNTERPSIAYFSMEFGIHNSLKIYSGGLGMLAGDYIKEASDSNVDMCGIGFLYRYGYFKQSLSMDGQQIANYDAQNFNSLPITKTLDKDGNQVVVDVPYMNYMVHALVWQANVGRVTLYLLDTDNEMNSEYDRPITHALYGGDWENRLKQEILLGIGGVLLLKKLGIKKQVYHCNEGHAALCNLQRLVDYIQEGLTFNQAMEVVRASSLYTVHTPVPAGHDYFDKDLFGKYMGGYPQTLGISWKEFIGMGRINPEDDNERFCMSTFACNTCQEVNGVSMLHGWVSQKMFSSIWNGYYPEENHVGYVTNGVHFPSWCATEWRKVYDKYLKKGFYEDQSNEELWHGIYDCPDAEIWKTRTELKNKLVKYIREKFTESWLKNQGDPARVVSLLERINPNALMIGFCRRFATYKRAHLLFTDLERLAKIVNNPDRPVLFFFSGKAHPADGAGQGLIKRIYEISQRPEFLGKIIFLENYDMALAKRLISGVDIWLNTPTRPLEASGTSGEKAQMNGVLNFSVLDGWWYEGYKKGAGWALTDKRTYTYQPHQDQLDAATIYSMLENEIVPLYFETNSAGYSPRWIQFIKNSFAKITPTYTTKRMLDDYIERFYSKQGKRCKSLKANDFAKAKEIVAWKEKVASVWDQVEIGELKLSDTLSTASSNAKYEATVTIDVKDPALVNSFGIEYVSTQMVDGVDKLFRVLEFKQVKAEGTKVTYQLANVPKSSGSFKFAFRLFPKNADLPHRQDFCYVRWF
ncbi:MAG: alpha-glucan family phosphorylase [Paludibacteraceae bacterium]|nr:alpha-glucan family phosphorylase [Paludibacteraceae bacterium]